MAWEVELTLEELRFAAYAGLENRLRAFERNRRPAHGFSGPGWDFQIEGRLAEQAWAKLTGSYIAASPDPDYGGDVGDRVQIRSTRYRPALLRLNKGDDPNHAFILAVGEGRRWSFPGWCWGREAMIEARWRDEVNGTKLREGGFYMPATDLHPIPESRVRT